MNRKKKVIKKTNWIVLSLTTRSWPSPKRVLALFTSILGICLSNIPQRPINSKIAWVLSIWSEKTLFWSKLVLTLNQNHRKSIFSLLETVANNLFIDLLKLLSTVQPDVLSEEKPQDARSSTSTNSSLEIAKEKVGMVRSIRWRIKKRVGCWHWKKFKKKLLNLSSLNSLTS